MTTVSSIITDAYRESNLIPLVGTPNANQVTEALRRLNVVILSSLGNEAGDGMTEYTLEGAYNNEASLTPWVPDNARLMFNVTESKTYLLDPFPKEGQRVSVVDVSNNLSTYPSVLDGNGRLIEAFTTADLNEDGMVRDWLYRSDIGTWVRITELEDIDDMPFPVNFDDYFITALAMRLNPRYGQAMSAESIQAFSRARAQFRARYNCPQEMLSDLTYINLYADQWGYYGSNISEFNTGRINRWS